MSLFYVSLVDLTIQCAVCFSLFYAQSKQNASISVSVFSSFFFNERILSSKRIWLLINAFDRIVIPLGFKVSAKRKFQSDDFNLKMNESKHYIDVYKFIVYSSEITGIHSLWHLIIMSYSISRNKKRDKAKKYTQWALRMSIPNQFVQRKKWIKISMWMEWISAQPLLRHGMWTDVRYFNNNFHQIHGIFFLINFPFCVVWHSIKTAKTSKKCGDKIIQSSFWILELVENVLLLSMDDCFFLSRLINAIWETVFRCYILTLLIAWPNLHNKFKSVQCEMPYCNLQSGDRKKQSSGKSSRQNRLRNSVFTNFSVVNTPYWLLFRDDFQVLITFMNCENSEPEKVIIMSSGN